MCWVWSWWKNEKQPSNEVTHECGSTARFQCTERVGGLVRWLMGKVFAAEAWELEFTSSARCKGMAAYSCSSSTGGMRQAGGCLGASACCLSYNGKLEVHWENLSEKIKWRAMNEPRHCQPHQIRVCGYIYTHSHLYHTHRERRGERERDLFLQSKEDCAKMWNSNLVLKMC